MRRLFLHFFIAAAMFYFGVTLSNAVKLTTPRVTTINNHQLPQTLEPPRTTSPTFNTFDEQALLEIFSQYGRAQTKHDRAFFERVESDHFILFQHDRKLTREQDIREMENGSPGVTYRWDIESIRVLGDSAVVIGRMHASYSNGPSSSWPFINVCVKNDNGWQILSTTSAE